MMNLLVVWVLSAVALIITSKLVSGFEIKDFKTAFIASIIIGLLNAILRPILILLSLPINLLTLGLFTFVINAAILKMAAGFLKDFNIKSWWTAICGAIVLVIIQMLTALAFY